MAVPKTENWTARENQHTKDGKPAGLHLLVGGTVEVSASNLAPQLAAGQPVGDLLPLDLTIVETSDAVVEHRGKPVAVWKAASYHSTCAVDQFNRVEVRVDGKPIATFAVINDTEHGKLLDKQAKAQNQVVAKVADKGGKSPVKKAVAKVKKAVGDLAEGAKTTLKKALKKVTKKAPKKAAKAAAKKTAKASKKVAKKAPKAVKKAAKKVTRKVAKKKAKRR
jgi:hypothetical protein